MGVKAVIFDLDGTILDTETVCFQVGQNVVAAHGKHLTKEIASAGIGKRPLECWQIIADKLGLDVPAQALVDASEPELQRRWPSVKVLPGAQRAIEHFRKHGVPLAIATSTSRASFATKLSAHPSVASAFPVVVCGDEVANGKPAPDIFAEASRQLGVDTAEVLVIEDAPSGIEAANAAGMRVVAVPSLVGKAVYASCKCDLLKTLLDLRPEAYGLPAFEDYVHGTVPLEEPWRIKGPVVKGFGRGSRELGIPTANISAEALGSMLSEAVTGIYYGWASLGGDDGAYKMVMSVGYNPFYGNAAKTCEPWILHDFHADFYDQELRLVVCGYVRPEADFTMLEALKARILEDGEVTKRALEDGALAALAQDPFLKPQ